MIWHKTRLLRIHLFTIQYNIQLTNSWDYVDRYFFLFICEFCEWIILSFAFGSFVWILMYHAENIKKTSLCLHSITPKPNQALKKYPLHVNLCIRFDFLLSIYKLSRRTWNKNANPKCKTKQNRKQNKEKEKMYKFMNFDEGKKERRIS